MNGSVSSCRRLIFCAALATSSVLLLNSVSGGTVATASTRTGHQVGLPIRTLFDVGVHSHVTRAQADKAVVSSSSFPQYQGSVKVGITSYSYVLAGKNPTVQVPNPASAIKVAIVPVIVKFSNGDTWDPTKTDNCDSGASPLSRVRNSPLFKAQSWTWGGKQVGTVQATDAYQRAAFWQYARPTGINTTYGITLTPTVLKPVTISVPSVDAKTVNISSCGNRHVGKISYSWLDGHLQSKTLPSLASEGISPSIVPVFLLHNVVEYDGSKCCDFGYHSATTSSPPQTYMVATYANYTNTPTPDIAAASHEVGEWQNDPYGNNPTPPWGHIGQVSGCKDNLEVGDPLTGRTFTDVLGGFTYHVQELAFFSWFYQQSPSLGLNGWYSDQGTFKAPAAPCGWGTAEEVPGTAALNTGGNAVVNSVSCGSAGDCSAGGYYTDSSGHTQAFLVNEVNGTWGNAEEVPGTAGLSTGGNAGITSLSCPSARNCSAGGYYTDSSGHAQAFLVNEVNGTWGNAEEVPGIAALNTGGYAGISSVSCSSAGNCSAGGGYSDSARHDQAFVVSEVIGAWGTAEEVPGTAALNVDGEAGIASVSCSPAGGCSAVGSYDRSSNHPSVFVVSEVGGTWGYAEEAPGIEALNTIDAYPVSVSCPSAGNCSAGGYYQALPQTYERAFVINEVNGTWGTAEEVPGTASDSHGATLFSLSCGAVGNCSAGGYYADNVGQHAFVANEVNGTWGTAEEVPGTKDFPASAVRITTVSCASAGNCSAGGFSEDNSFNQQAFVVNEVDGTWGTAEEVPGTAALNTSAAWVTSMSCPSASNCSAGGYYTDASGHEQVFVVNRS